MKDAKAKEKARQQAAMVAAAKAKKLGHHRDKLLDICFDFTRGTCNRENCRFSHDLPPNGQIPPRPKTAGVCFDFTKGICKRGYVLGRRFLLFFFFLFFFPSVPIPAQDGFC